MLLYLLVIYFNVFVVGNGEVVSRIFSLFFFSELEGGYYDVKRFRGLVGFCC